MAGAPYNRTCYYCHSFGHAQNDRHQMFNAMVDKSHVSTESLLSNNTYMHRNNSR